MSPLCVFLCDNQSSYDRLKKTKDDEYHRFFILSSNGIIRNNLTHKSTDNFMTYNFDSSRLDMLSRLVTCYSDPMYSHILIALNENFNFDEEKKNFIQKEHFQNLNCLGFTRQYVALNGFDFKPAIEKLKVNPIEYAVEIGRAMNEEPVENIFFIEALKELMPECEYTNLENLKYLDQEIVDLIKNKNNSSSSKYSVLYEPNLREIKNALVFSKSKLDSYKYLVKRIDGLNCYIF